MLERLKSMLIKEFIQIFRDPRMRGVILLMPIVQALVFGYAVTTDVRNVPTALVDLDNSVESRELVSGFVGSGYFHITDRVVRIEDARRLVDEGRVGAVLAMNPGFGADLRSGRAAPVQLIVDGTDSNTAGIVLDYARRIVSGYNEGVVLKQARRLGADFSSAAVRAESRAWFNANLESRYFYVPGVIALIVMLVALMLSSMAIVREKEIGTIEQIMVTPVRQSEFILGKTVPFAAIGFADVAVISLIAVFWFEVPIRGSLPLLLAATGLYLMSTLGIGLLISTVSQTQQQAMMSAFFVYFPAVLLSGFMFPIANMPEAVQWLTYLNPLRYFLVIVRGVFLKGVGPSTLWPQMLALTVLGFLMLGLAVRRFRKTAA
jgi:ABC-2 type transport system permease protein